MIFDPIGHPLAGLDYETLDRIEQALANVPMINGRWSIDDLSLSEADMNHVRRWVLTKEQQKVNAMKAQARRLTELEARLKPTQTGDRLARLQERLQGMPLEQMRAGLAAIRSLKAGVPLNAEQRQLLIEMEVIAANREAGIAGEAVREAAAP